MDLDLFPKINEQKNSMLNSMTQDCFEQCVHEFPSKICDRDEMACIENCADRYLKFRLRVGQKFQYYQALKVAEMKKKKKEGAESSSS